MFNMDRVEFYENEFRTKLDMFSLRKPLMKDIGNEQYLILIKILSKLSNEFKLSEGNLSLISQLKFLSKDKGDVNEVLVWMTINSIFLELKGISN